jgi:hypothetical protein
MNCCNTPLSLSLIYSIHKAFITCHICGHHKDIDIPKHIPESQFKQYASKKYMSKHPKIIIDNKNIITISVK